MTTFTRTTTVRTADASRREAESLLRDAAFVLSLTQRVKSEMLGGRPVRRSAPTVRSRELCLASA